MTTQISTSTNRMSNSPPKTFLHVVIKILNIVALITSTLFSLSIVGIFYKMLSEAHQPINVISIGIGAVFVLPLMAFIINSLYDHDTLGGKGPNAPILYSVAITFYIGGICILMMYGYDLLILTYKSLGPNDQSTTLFIHKLETVREVILIVLLLKCVWFLIIEMNQRREVITNIRMLILLLCMFSVNDLTKMNGPGVGIGMTTPEQLKIEKYNACIYPNALKRFCD